MYVLAKGRVSLVALAMLLWTGLAFGYGLAYLRSVSATVVCMFAGFALLGWAIVSGALLRWLVSPRWRWLLAHGRPAAALVTETAFGDLRWVSGDDRLTSMRVWLTVQPVEGAPYEVSVKGLVRSGSMPVSGQRVRVRCAPSDPREVAIVPPELAGPADDDAPIPPAPADVSAANSLATEDDAPVTPASAGVGAADGLAKLVELARLLDGGSITPAEFEDKKRELLSRM